MSEEKENNNEKDENEEVNDIVVKGVTLSKSRIDITFPDETSNISRVTVKTYKSTPFQPDHLDLDLPNFRLTRFNKSSWKMTHGCSYLVFTILYSISTAFLHFEKSTYYTLIGLSHGCLALATLLEWCNFKRGCIGSSNLNTKLKKNVDKSWKAQLLRSEFGIKYFISFMASIMFIFGDFIYLYSDSLNLNPDDANINLVYFNLFGMMTLALSQIMKLDKILNVENKISYLKEDFSKSLFEIFFFFASLLEGGTFMIQLFNIHLKQSPLYIFHLIMKIFDGVVFFTSGIILVYNYFCFEVCGCG